MNKLDTFVAEIDENYGIRLRELPDKLKTRILDGRCINCEQKLKEYNPPILYVEFFAGKILWWHKRVDGYKSGCDY